MATAGQKTNVHRGPRRWPYIPPEPILVQPVQVPSKPAGIQVIVIAASLVGLLVSAVIYSRLGGGAAAGLAVGFLAVSGLAMLASLVIFYVQTLNSNQDARTLAAQYRAYLDKKNDELKVLTSEEFELRRDKDKPPEDVIRSLANHPERLWQRKSNDPDFLEVRIGSGDQPSWIHITLAQEDTPATIPAKDVRFRHLQQKARDLVGHYATQHDVPITLSLHNHVSIAIISSGEMTHSGVSLARSITAHVLLHHSEQELQVVIFTSGARHPQWLESRQPVGQAVRSIASTDAERKVLLNDLLTELSRREQVTRGRTYGEPDQPMLPHLLIVVDADISDPKSSVQALGAGIALALGKGRELGATVISLHESQHEAPAEATIAIDVAERVIRSLGADRTRDIECKSIDQLGTQRWDALLHALTQFVLEDEATLTLPRTVSLLRLFTPPIFRPDSYPVEEFWNQARNRAKENSERASFPVPIGMKAGNEPLVLDFVADGPHGLLIGQTGSGKSEMLRSIVAALAIQYPPDMVNIVLADYKGGLAFDTLSTLPHVVAYLTNMERESETTRFLTMMNAEIMRRERAKKQGIKYPELFVIIDEFAEMVSRRNNAEANELILENLLRITRLGRELGIHLLFASQRAEGSVIQRLIGYIQFEICLRTNSEDSSREVIGRPDAANLPVEIPGRGLLLRGDNELTLFQTGRVATPYFQSQELQHASRVVDSGERISTVDQIIVSRMQSQQADTARRWPQALVSPTLQRPTPVVLNGTATDRAEGTVCWSQSHKSGYRTMEIPLGLFDRPSEQRQDWYLADLLGHEGRMQGGPLLVVGDFNAGKSTTLQTMLLYFAMTTSPSLLRWFVLDPSGALSDFRVMPHVEDMREVGARNLIDGRDGDELSAFIRRLETSAADTSPSRPAILFVVDDYDELAERRDTLHDVTERLIRLRENRVYVALAASKPSYNGLPPRILNSMATRVVLHMGDSDQFHTLIGTRLSFAPDLAPGRGLVQTRSLIEEIQIACPVSGSNDLERMKRLTDAISEAARHWRA